MIELPTIPFNYEEFLSSNILIPLVVFFFYSSFARFEAFIDFISILELEDNGLIYRTAFIL